MTESDCGLYLSAVNVCILHEVVVNIVGVAYSIV